MTATMTFGARAALLADLERVLIFVFAVAPMTLTLPVT